MSASASIVAVALMVVILPHRLALERAAPVTAAVVWALALLVRALALFVVGVLAFAWLAQADLIESIFGTCWHEVLPRISERLGFAEHPVAHAAVAIPLLFVSESVATQTGRLIRAASGFRRRLDADATDGPDGSLVIADDAVLVAVTRLGRGRVVVSDRALAEMDEGELAASLAHEAAHLRRHHRPLVWAASILATIGRPLPGTAAADRELSFQLERDADAAAVRRLNDPLSLASAICKVARSRVPSGGAGLSGSGPVTRRVAELLDGATARSRSVERTARLLAAVLAIVAMALPLSATASAFAVGAGDSQHHCKHGHA